MNKNKKTLSNVDQKNWVHLKPGEKIFTCKKCLTLSTRPRVEYDEEGVCNACTWAKEKKITTDWDSRWKRLEEICNKYRRDDGYWDVIVPCSGGKDGTYVAWMMKHKLNMNPLCMTVKPNLRTKIGKENLDNFKASGFDHIEISPNPKVYRALTKKTFVEQGRPKQPFEIAISTAILNIATKLGIPFIMYGEEGESEYSGTAPSFNNFKISRDYLIDCYYSGHDPKEFLELFDIKDLQCWTLPTKEELDKAELYPTHWSNFENWDPLEHYLLAKEKCGFKELPDRSIGTFSNYAQLDDKLQEFHAYMMQIKFGFGRAWSDACIEIRAGRMTREEGIELVKKYDGEFPEEYLEDYLEYYDMSELEFFDTIDAFRDPNVWEKVNGEWKLKFEIE